MVSIGAKLWPSGAWKSGACPMILAVLVGLSQVADGLAYQLAQGHGTELNPGAS